MDWSRAYRLAQSATVRPVGLDSWEVAAHDHAPSCGQPAGAAPPLPSCSAEATTPEAAPRRLGPVEYDARAASEHLAALGILVTGDEARGAPPAAAYFGAY